MFFSLDTCLDIEKLCQKFPQSNEKSAFSVINPREILKSGNIEEKKIDNVFNTWDSV